MASPVTARISGSIVGRVVRFDQTKAFGKHTVATMDIAYAAARPWVAPEWAPVEVSLDGTLWCGYVHHGGVSSDVRDASGSVVRYTLIGTSLPMNTQRTRSWRGVSASSLVRQIGREHRLRTVVTPHKTVLPYYAQAGSSDWKVLQDMAKRTGHRLWVDVSTLSFVEPRLLLEGVRTLEVPTFAQNKVPGVQDSLFSFTSKAGAMIPRPKGKYARQVIHGLDARTARPVKATTTPSGPTNPLTVVNTDVRAATSGQATDVVTARDAGSNGWVTATAVVRGAAGVNPGSLVNIAGTQIPEEDSGRWLVTEVNHRVLLDLSNPVVPFTTTLTLERDQTYDVTLRSALRTSNTRDLVPATMRNGVLWEAEYMENINVG